MIIPILAFLSLLILITPANTLRVSTISNRGLVVAYHLDEGRGTTIYNSITSFGGFSATLITPAWVTGRDHFGLKFDGVTDYFQFPANAQFSPANNGVAYAASYKIPVGVSSTSKPLFTKVDTANKYEFNFGCFVGDSAPNQGRLRLSLFSLDAASQQDLYTVVTTSDNQWHRALFTMEQSNANTALIQVWVDGVLSTASRQGNYVITDGSSKVTMGRNQTGYASYIFDGTLENVCFWNRFLTPAEAKLDYIISRGFTNTNN